LVRFDIAASNAKQRGLLDRKKLFGPAALMFLAIDSGECADLQVIGEINPRDFAERVHKANDRI
jgi:thiol:disulfide interchange protein DsbD